VTLALHPGVPVALLALAACAPIAEPVAEPDPAALELPTIGGELVRPLAPSEAREEEGGAVREQAVVFLFTLTDCPISNRYAPRVNALANEYTARGVRFWLVYPDATETDDEVRLHLTEYGYEVGALRDPDYSLVRLAGATVTPEAAVFVPGGTLAYRGRIDNRHAGYGKTRVRADERDLARALDEILAGDPVSVPRTKAVGCYIPGP
jgi:hypothetical protein